MPPWLQLSQYKDSPMAPRVSTLPDTQIMLVHYGLTASASRWFFPDLVGTGSATEVLFLAAARPWLTFHIEVEGAANLYLYLKADSPLAHPNSVLWKVIPLYAGVVNELPQPIRIPSWSMSLKITDVSGAPNFLSGNIQLRSLP